MQKVDIVTGWGRGRSPLPPNTKKNMILVSYLTATAADTGGGGGALNIDNRYRFGGDTRYNL